MVYGLCQKLFGSKWCTYRYNNCYTDFFMPVITIIFTNLQNMYLKLKNSHDFPIWCAGFLMYTTFRTHIEKKKTLIIKKNVKLGFCRFHCRIGPRIILLSVHCVYFIWFLIWGFNVIVWFLYLFFTCFIELHYII